MRKLMTIAVLVALTGAACASSGARSGPRTDRTLITRQQIETGGYRTAYDAVLSLRSNWLQERGRDSFANPSIVLVYLDGTKMGGIDELKGIPAHSVESIKHHDGISASARWGLDHGQGVIEVKTRVGL